MRFINSEQLEQTLTYDTLIDRLDKAFESNNVKVPLRHHHNFNSDNTLLLMPAWQNKKYGGVKIVTVAPENKNTNLPSIQGVYYLFNATTGIPLCTLDAATLTSIRTAAASALASSYLSRKNSEVLLMIGTGNLAPYLIKAHANVRPITKVLIYGRSYDKAVGVCQQLEEESFECTPIRSLENSISEADIISCATLSNTPVVHGSWLKPGQHVDLVGSFKPDMREADDELIVSSSVYLDTFEGATKESGDIVIPLRNGTIEHDQIKGDLFDLCSQKVKGRTSGHEITCFKSVGHALEDLVAAELAFSQMG